VARMIGGAEFPGVLWFLSSIHRRRCSGIRDLCAADPAVPAGGQGCASAH
jgi:hypothetical protein